MINGVLLVAALTTWMLKVGAPPNYIFDKTEPPAFNRAAIQLSTLKIQLLIYGLMR